MIDEKILIAKLEQCRHDFDDLLGPKIVGQYKIRKYVTAEQMNYFLTRLIEYVESLRAEGEDQSGT